MGILVIFVFLLIAIFVAWLVKTDEKKEDEEGISEVADVFRRIGYGDKKAITEEWGNLKKTYSKRVMCQAWSRVSNEFQNQGNIEAVNLLAYWVGDEIRKYLEELRDFYEKADEDARNWMNRGL